MLEVLLLLLLRRSTSCVKDVKTVGIGVKRDRCNERILRNCAHEIQFVGERYTPTCINPCLCGAWKERYVDIDFTRFYLYQRMHLFLSYTKIT